LDNAQKSKQNREKRRTHSLWVPKGREKKYGGKNRSLQKNSLPVYTERKNGKGKETCHERPLPKQPERTMERKPKKKVRLNREKIH